MNLLSNRCPRCREGEIYRSFLKMNEDCPHCSFVFERQPGYFTGAMFLNCFFLPASMIPLFLLFAYNGKIIPGGIVAVILMIFLSPFSFRYSRIFWIQMDYGLNHSP